MNIERAVSSSFTALPVLPLRDVVIFPNIMVPLFIGREKSVNALEYAISSSNHQNEIFLVAQKDGSVDNPEPEDQSSIFAEVNSEWSKNEPFMLEFATLVL